MKNSVYVMLKRGWLYFVCGLYKLENYIDKGALAMRMILMAIFAVMVSFPALAADKSAGQVVLETVFSESEKVIIEEYFGQAKTEYKHGGGKNKGLPPGLAKKETLPPGLSKHIAEHGTLPPGLAARDLPDDLSSRLGSPKKGTKRVIVGDDVYLIQEGTRQILDVIKGVLSTTG
jgi:hypothetical protein